MCAIVGIVQSDDENAFSPQLVQFQASGDLREEINIPDVYPVYPEDFIDMLETFKFMKHRDLDQITTATDSVDLDPPAPGPIKPVS